MKKINIFLIPFITMPVWASNFVIRINQNVYDYDVTTDISYSYTEWLDSGELYDCESDIDSLDVYTGQTQTQTTECLKDQTSIRTTTKTFEDGSTTETTDTVSRTVSELSESIISGTLILSDCNSIYTNGHSIGDGYYTINPLTNSFDAYCDMTTDDGGWTRIVFEGSVFGTSDYQDEINAMWGNGLGKYLKYENHPDNITMYYNRITSYDYDFYTDALRTWKDYGHTLGTTFNINESYEDLKSGTNNYTFCNYSNDADLSYEHEGVGFPRDCGQSSFEGGRWLVMDYNSVGYKFTRAEEGYYTLWIK